MSEKFDVGRRILLKRRTHLAFPGNDDFAVETAKSLDNQLDLFVADEFAHHEIEAARAGGGGMKMIERDRRMDHVGRAPVIAPDALGDET